MAYLNPTEANTALAADFNMAPGWAFSEFKFGASPTVTTADVLDLFFGGIAVGHFVADWVIFMEQVDTNATPTVSFNVGVAGDSTAISGSTGLRWASATTELGRTGTISVLRAPNGSHMQQNGHANKIGLQCSTLPATAAWANKRIWMGILLLPTASMGS